jgi:hypothetical protein
LYSLRTSLVAIAAAGIVSLGSARPTFAQGTPPFTEASAVWDRSGATDAGPIYEKAIDAGGLGPVETVIAYTRIGIARAMLGKRDLALSAFRSASNIDPDFELPPDASPRARPLYEQARREAAGRPRMAIKVTAPDRVGFEKSFVVKTEMSDESAALIDRIEIDVSDTLSKKTAYTSSQPVAESLTFQVPSQAATSGATLLVQLRALDMHSNRWLTQDVRVSVDAGEAAPQAVGAPADSGESKPKKSVFRGPWPYVIGGGVLLVSGISAFLLLRSNDQTTIGAPAWSER